MRKHFPTKIRLKGNQDVAAAYIRQAKIELLRTDDVRREMGVPIFGKDIELGENVWMGVQIVKGQRIVTIHADVPSEKAIEHLAQREEEEEQRCEPAFLVYRNDWRDTANAPNYEYDRHYGHKIVYRRGGWQLEQVPDTDKYCGNAAWYHVRDNYRKYYNKKALKECDLISWNANRAGAFDSTRWVYTEPGFNSQYRTNQVFMAGKWYNGTPTANTECIGACYLPNKEDKKDYFYTIGYTRYDATSFLGTHFRVYRFDRDPDIFAPTGSATVVLTITAADLATATGGINSSVFARPGYSAYINKDGIAYITFSQEYQVDDGHSAFSHIGNQDPDTPFNDSSYMSLGIQGDHFVSLLEIDLQNATWTASNTGKSGSPRYTYADKTTSSDRAVVGLSGYGDINLGGSTSGENDLYSKAGTVVTWKEPGTQIVRPGASISQFMSTTVSGEPGLICVYGGCDALYEYKLRVSSAAHEATVKGSVTLGTSLRPEGETNAPASQPVYSHEISQQDSGANLKNELVLYKDGEEIWTFTVMEQGYPPWGSGHSKKQIRSRTTSASLYYDIQEADDQTSFNYLNEATSEPLEQVDTANQGCCSYTPLLGYTEDVWVHRTVLFCHPQIPDLYTYLERRCYRGSQATTYTVSISYHIVQNGADTEVWETAKAISEGGAFKAYRFIDFNLGSYTRDDPSSSTAWVEADNIDVTVNIPVAGNGASGYQNIPGTPFSLSNTYIYHASRKGMNGLGFTWLFMGEEDHKVVSLRDTGETSPGNYRRATCAVHHKDFGPGRSAYPYLVYLRHPVPNLAAGEGAFDTATWSTIDTETDTPSSVAYFPPFDEKNPDGQLYSNVLSLEKIKKLTGEDNDFPADFGVI